MNATQSMIRGGTLPKRELPQIRNNDPVKTKNDHTRQELIDAGLNYSICTIENLSMLSEYIDDALSTFNKIHQDMIMCVNRGSKCPHGVHIWRSGADFVGAEITVNGPYFKDREAVTFNSDGFIGIAGWAADDNAAPFVEAFCAWVHKMKEVKQ